MIQLSVNPVSFIRSMRLLQGPSTCAYKNVKKLIITKHRRLDR